MENKIRVFMVDDNQSVVKAVKEYFEKHAVIEVIGNANNGEEALEKIIRYGDRIDLIIMDFIIPKMDGLSVLEELKKKGINKKSIIITGMNSLEVIKKCTEVGVSYYMLKPFRFEALEKHIVNSMTKQSNTLSINDRDLKQAITTLLHSLGIPSHIKGYRYIREGIDLMYNKPSMLGAITKELYPEIAERYDTTTSRVERAIRHAIEVSWTRGDYELMEDIFGHSVDYDRAKPTNSEFIATLADKLRLERSYE